MLINSKKISFKKSAVKRKSLAVANVDGKSPDKFNVFRCSERRKITK